MSFLPKTSVLQIYNSLRIFVQSHSLNILPFRQAFIINLTIFYVDSAAVEHIRVGTMVLIKKK